MGTSHGYLLREQFDSGTAHLIGVESDLKNPEQRTQTTSFSRRGLIRKGQPNASFES